MAKVKTTIEKTDTGFNVKVNEDFVYGVHESQGLTEKEAISLAQEAYEDNKKFIANFGG